MLKFRAKKLKSAKCYRDNTTSFSGFAAGISAFQTTSVRLGLPGTSLYAVRSGIGTYTVPKTENDVN